MIADRRELYNDQVYRYNARIGQVPAVLLAGAVRLAAAGRSSMRSRHRGHVAPRRALA